MGSDGIYLIRSRLKAFPFDLEFVYFHTVRRKMYTALSRGFLCPVHRGVSGVTPDDGSAGVRPLRK